MGARVFLEPNPLKPLMCSPVLAAPRVDLAEVELTEEEVKMLTVNIIQEAGLRADIQGVCLKMGLYTYTILYHLIPQNGYIDGIPKKRNVIDEFFDFGGYFQTRLHVSELCRFELF